MKLLFNIAPANPELDADMIARDESQFQQESDDESTNPYATTPSPSKEEGKTEP